MNYTLCRYYRESDGPRKENDPSEERLKLSVSFYGSRSPKISFSITTDQLVHSRLIAGENESFGGREQENDIENFGRF